MKILQQNISNILGKEGEQWFKKLPAIIQALQGYWNLTDITPVDNMTFNYVAKAIHNNHQPVVLKISCQEKWMQGEKQVLQDFNGRGSVKLIDHHEQYHALLLQQAIPGITLKSLYLEHSEYVIEVYADTLRKLHAPPFFSHSDYPHVSDWLKALDKVTSEAIPKHLLQQAIRLKNLLLAKPEQAILLHGDLHHDNILQNGNEWLVIDPKGIIGTVEFEVAAFDFIRSDELESREDIGTLFAERVRLLAEKTHLNLQSIKEWVFVRLILSAAWSIEDKSDPTWAIKLTNKIADQV